MRAVITGGTKGIGRAVAERLGGPGSRMIVNYNHDEVVASEVVAELEGRGGWALAVKADGCSEQGAGALAEAAAEHLGRIDGLVHCAVTTRTSSALEIDPKAFRETIDQNGSSVLWLAQRFRPLLGQGSSMVFVSSVGSTLAVPGYVAVGAGKALGESIVRYLAAELAADRIRVNSVCAGTVDTEALRSVAPDPEAVLARARAKSPSKRDLHPSDVAEVIAFLLGDQSQMVVGDVVRVDGGVGIAY